MAMKNALAISVSALRKSSTRAAPPRSDLFSSLPPYGKSGIWHPNVIFKKIIWFGSYRFWEFLHPIDFVSFIGKKIFSRKSYTPPTTTPAVAPRTLLHRSGRLDLAQVARRVFFRFLKCVFFLIVSRVLVCLLVLFSKFL
jgi:hypothetical protein